jgi:hypothetical protein
MESIQRRASREFCKWVASAKHEWYHTVLRIRPPRFCVDARVNSESVKSRLFKSLRWTLSEVRRKLNDDENFNFVPVWGGDPKSGVGIHIHALIEIPKNGRIPTAFKSFFESEFQRLSTKAFRVDVRPKVFVSPVRHSSEFPLSMLTNYPMRWEGDHFGKGTEKLITELLQLRDT